MTHHLLDTQYTVETPEAIDLSVQLAGSVPRILAYSIDLSIRGVALFVLFLILALLGKAGMGLFMAVSFLLEWFYPVFFELFRNGQTPGKRYLNLAVVNSDLTSIELGPSMIRNLLRAVDFLPIGYLLGIASISVSSHFQRFGDLAAGTLVIHRPVSRANFSLPSVKPVAPPMKISVDDQLALTGFAQRHQQLSEQRKEELANLLQDVTHKRGTAAVAYLQGVGCWLLGDKK